MGRHSFVTLRARHQLDQVITLFLKLRTATFYTNMFPAIN